MLFADKICKFIAKYFPFMKLLLLQQAKYNYWANKKYIEFFEHYPGFLHKEVLSSFKTPELTLLHIFQAQQVWLARLLNKDIDYSKLKNHQLKLSDLLISSQKIIDFVTDTDAMDLKNEIHYQNLMKQVFSQPAYQIILHVVNHGTYHRGQISLMLKQLKADNIPATDLIHFFNQEYIED
jgi:uncharacterized damage-inducible protein DinB